MDGLHVANPEGFSSDYFLELAHGDVNVDFKSLMEDTVELPELNLKGLDVNLDRKGLKGNYDVILDNLKKNESSGGGGEGKKFVIHTVNLDNIKVHVDTLPVGGEATKLDLKIDDITMHDVGTGKDAGMGLTQVYDVLLKAVFTAIVEKGGGIIPDDILGGIGDGLKGLGSLGDMGIKFTTGAVQDLGKVGEDVVKGAGDAVKNIGEGVGEGLNNLLGGEKKKDDGE